MSRLEWDEVKNQKNLRKHGISFETAAMIFLRPYMEIWDEAHSGYNKYGEWEDRYATMGWVDDVLYVCYTVREHDDQESIRLISARLAEENERELFFRWLNGQR
ncbi:MAG: BrnT family toxin [Clostridia bacterium]|nr:BrnT family toxin [Clostridia bacterium]